MSVYLSPAPHAEPQAAGFSSGLSSAPHAEPQAAGFSFGLSPAPHAEAGAAAAFHPDKLKSAIMITSVSFFTGFLSACIYIVIYGQQSKKYALFYNQVTFF